MTPPIYVPGEFERMHETLFEGICLCRGLFKLGVRHEQLAVRLERVAPGDGATKSLYGHDPDGNEFCAFVG